MKTYNNLFGKIADPENIKAAIYKAAKHKRKKYSVQRCLAEPEKTAAEISAQLLAGTWQPVKIHNVHEINDGITRKKRLIACPEFKREQVVHHAIMRVCAPLFTKKFYRYNCGSIPGKGPQFTAKFIAKELLNKKKTKYYAKLDIRKFFENTSPLAALREIKRTIRDRRVLLLFAQILRHNAVRMPDGTKTRHGLLIGFYTSPWVANIVLNPLDHLIKEQCGVAVAVRYMDDILLMDGNKRRLKRAIAAIKEYLTARGLELKHEPAVHRVDNGKLVFIGYKFTRGKTVMGGDTFLRARRMVKRIAEKEKPTVFDARRIVSCAGRFKHINAHKAFKKYIAGKVSIKRCKRIISKTDRRDGHVESSREQYHAGSCAGA